jgi:hypothetical protein
MGKTGLPYDHEDPQLIECAGRAWFRLGGSVRKLVHGYSACSRPPRLGLEPYRRTSIRIVDGVSSFAPRYGRSEGHGRFEIGHDPVPKRQVDGTNSDFALPVDLEVRHRVKDLASRQA